MGGRVRSWWPFAAAGAIAVAVMVGLATVWRSSDRAGLEGFAGLAISVAGVAAGWIGWVWRARDRQLRGVASAKKLGRLADLLAGAAEAEWRRAAGERGLLEPEPIAVRWRRPALPLTGPAAAALASRRFAPLPGLAAVSPQRLRSGQVSELHEVYGGLGSGRLVIAGGPGSGKSGAAVLLILAALQHRRSVPDLIRPQVPVPVMFTLHGWDPGLQLARDWLAERLGQAYALLASRAGATTARAMLNEGRVAVILDGLDEISADLRPTVLRALSKQATFRLVLLTRSAEMAEATAQELLQGAAAVELQDVSPAAAAGYLTRIQLDPPPRGWHELTGRLRKEPRSPLAQALNNPLMLTLVRDTYRAGDDVGELLSLRDAAGHAASADDITIHLLDRVLPAAYARQPGEPPPRYDLATAERALRRIATRMNKDGTRDLQWWRVPGWAHALPRVIATMLAAGLAAGLVAGLRLGVTTGGVLAEMPGEFRVGTVLMVGIGVVGAVVGGIMAWAQAAPRVITTGLGIGLVVGLVFGLAVAITAGLLTQLPGGPIFELNSWLAFTAVGGIGGAVVGGIMAWAQAAPRAVTSRFGFGLVVGLTFGLVVAVAGELVYGPEFGFLSGLLSGLELGVVFGAGAGLTAGLASGNRNKSPRRIAPVRWRQLFRGRPLAIGLIAGILIGALTGFSEYYRLGVMAYLGPGLVAALVAWLGNGLIAGMSWPETGNASPLSPFSSRRSDQAFGLIVGLVVWLGVGLVLGIAFGTWTRQVADGLGAGLEYGLMVAVTVGLVYPQSWSASLACAQLAVSDRTPVRLMRFLEDARSRGVLRTVGPVYQFRHARLHDRLAEAENR